MTETRVKPFYIPIENEELLRTESDRFSVNDIVPPGALAQALDASRLGLQKDGPKFILEHFDTFFSVIVHGSKVHFPLTLRAFDRIHKATNLLIDDMENLYNRGGEINSEDKPLYLSINKMYAYLLSSLSCYIEDYIANNSTSKSIQVKKKKQMKKTDDEEQWEEERQKALETIHHWLQLPLHMLWTPPIVEHTFINVLAQFCYKVLESSKDSKEKKLRESVFDILGALVKRYNYGNQCVERVIQLVKLYDSLTPALAGGVVHMISSTGCLGFLKGILQEISQNESSEADARNISTFLESVASSNADLVLPILDSITEHLTSEFYTMRNCVLGVLGAVVLGALTGDDLDENKRKIRDECLNNLEDHLLDVNAYVRSKCLQIWQKLCCQGAIILRRQCSLLKATILRLEDKAAIVRKQALHLLRGLLQNNPFAGRFDQDRISEELEDAKAKLREIQINVAKLSSAGDAERLELWQERLPEVEKAISEVFSENEENDSGDEEDEDYSSAFETVRQLLLTGKIIQAVKELKNIFTKIPDAMDLSEMPSDSKEHYILMLLLKIFMESEDAADTDNPDEADGAAAESQNSIRKKELKRCREELNVQQKLVIYFTNCLDFAKQLENCVPFLETLIFSTTTGDAVEACTFLGTAYQFGIPGAESAIRKALFQVMSSDQSVRSNVAIVYKTIYLGSNDENENRRQKSVNSMNRLIELLKALEPGQSSALCQLIGTWYKNKDIDALDLRFLWEKFSMIMPNPRIDDSRAALILLTMIAETEPSLFTLGNFDILIKTGLESPPREDLLLARDTCRGLLKVRRSVEDPDLPPLKYRNDHVVFEKIVSLIKDYFTSTEDNGYVSFVTDAINVIYHLANEPCSLVKSILLDITKKANLFTEMGTEASQENPTQTNHVTDHLLSRVLYIVGHIAIRQMIHLDNEVYKELRRRNAVKKLKKGNSGKSNPQTNPVATPVNTTRRSIVTPSSARLAQRNREKLNSTSSEDGQEVLEGATADDEAAEMVIAALENDVVTGNGILSKFVPLILDVCRNPAKYNDERCQAWGTLALCKFMTVSSIFCTENLQLLVTIMERSPYSGIRADVLVGMRDLLTRFPNQVEPWTSHIYGRLRDDDVKVRRACVRVLLDLILREMIRVKGQVSELALCIVDPDEEIRTNAKNLFMNLSQKGNALYNVMPDILSRLTDTELDLNEADFQVILKYILGLIQKERQIDTIIEKVCTRFVQATSERQWRGLSYCLSLLQFSAKSIRKLTDSLPLMKEKIHHKFVQTALQTIIDQTKNNPLAKAACTELEEKIETLLKTTEELDEQERENREIMPPPPVPPKSRKSTRGRKRRKTSDECDSLDVSTEEDQTKRKRSTELTPRASARIARKTPQKTSVNDEEEEKEEEDFANKSRKTRTPRRPRRNVRRSASEDEENNSHSLNTPTSAKKSKRMKKSNNSLKAASSSSDSEEEVTVRRSSRRASSRRS